MYQEHFNTSTLGYKLLSGSLRKKRKHSEQLNKMLAGLIDTDGTIGMRYYKSGDKRRQKASLYISISLTDTYIIEALYDFYNLGSVCYPKPPEENWKPQAQWTLGEKDSKILLNRILKHLRLKAKLAHQLMWLTDQLKGVLDIPNVDELKEYVNCLRATTTYLKMPKHLSWAYVAGVIAGDGSIQFLDRGGRHKSPQCYIAVSQGDKGRLLKLFQRDFKGGIYKISTGAYNWQRNLGPQNASFAVPFLKKIRMYIPHVGKYEKINKILEMHEERRQQRLNKGESKD